MLWLQGSMCPKNKQSRKDSSNRSEMRWLKSRYWDLSFHRVMDFQSRYSLSPTELQQSLPTFLSSVNHIDDLQIVFGPLREKKWKSWKRISERIWEVVTNQVTAKIGSSRLTKIVMLSLYLFFQTIERTDLSTGTPRLEDRRHLQCAQWTRASNVCVLDQPFMKGIAA